jgi:pimeloyl-ACP methyl ester carboxylesterase
MRDILVTVVNEEYRDELSRIAGPIHFLWGAADTEVPVAVAEEAVALVNDSGGDATIEVIEEVGHLLPVQDPDSLRTAVTRMLA